MGLLGGLAARHPEVTDVRGAGLMCAFSLPSAEVRSAVLTALREEEHVLLLTLHHIVCDAWSQDIFFRELGECYAAFTRGERPNLPELAVQYPDFAVWQRALPDTADFTRQLDYWRSQLRDVPRLSELPLDRPRPARRSRAGG